MEKTYKTLKMVLLVLCFVAVLVGAKLLYDNLGSRMEMNTLATQATQPPQTTSPVEETNSHEATQPTEATEDSHQAPDFTAYDLEGNPVSLSDFRGKPVILNFWASWCGPCKMEMPDFEVKFQEYGEQIHFLMVNLTDGAQETVETASGFIGQHGYTFPVYFDSDQSGAIAYGVNAVPVTYFLDAQGNFVAWQQGALSADVLQQGIDMLIP